MKQQAIREFEQVLLNAPDYQTWRDAAMELDRLDGGEQWKEEDHSPLYDYALIRQRLNELQRLRERGDMRALIFVLHEGLHGNLGNMANPGLYGQCRVGTKHLITNYINELVEVLNYLLEADIPGYDDGEKLRFFKLIGMTYGRSALMLSGGAAFGLFHVGVVKALWDEGLLPRVISGSSAGSIVASAVCTHTDEELPQLFDQDYINTQAFKMLSPKDMLEQRALLDNRQLAECLRHNAGNYTFEEAFERTGRMLNITVSPAHSHHQPRLMNFMTSPSALIYQTSVASSAVPGVYPAVQLKGKNSAGETIPYLADHLWLDGSLKSDLPKLRIARLHNVNHYIVSQTNPHVVMFMKSGHQKRGGMRPFLTDLATSAVQTTANQLLHTVRRRVPTETMQRVADELHSITRQNYRGDVTVVAQHSPLNYLRLFENMSARQLGRYIDMGDRQTWPHIEQIRNSSIISLTIEAAIQQLKAKQRTQQAQSLQTANRS